MTEPALCKCHGEPMLWNRDPRYRRGGHWRCRIRHNAQNRGYYAPKAEARRRQVSDYYHAVGWMKKRRRELAAQRTQVLERLAQLAKEAEDSC